MTLLDKLGNFTWDAKLAIVMAAFAASYGEFWLIIQLYPSNPLAFSVGMLKQLPNNLTAFRPRFKALSILVKNMVEVTECVIEFEFLCLQQVKMDNKVTSRKKSDIYVAAYWVMRSALTCSSLVTDLISKNHENLTSTTTAIWELRSLVCKMSGICDYLRKQVAIFHMETEENLHQKLLKLFNDAHNDNQEVLSTLFSLKDDMPLKRSSTQQKLGVSELLDKVVLLLISHPDILLLEDLPFLVQQTCSNEFEISSYEVVWVPLPSSSTWSDTELEVFNELSNTLPWYSLQEPWLLSSVVVKYIKEVWKFVDKPLMVVLDHNGKVSSTNAISMALIWGAVAYPFSISREQQLWEETNWSLKLVLGEIDPLLSMQVEEGRIIFLYGSEDLEWIREFTSKIKEIISTGVRLELIYVGKRNPGKSVSGILAAIADKELSGYLSLHQMHFFWLRLESVQSSKCQVGMTTDVDRILKEVVSLMSYDDNSWALLGEGSSPDTVQYHGSELMQRLNSFPLWAQNIENVGFLNAMRCGLEPTPLTKHSYRCTAVPYIEGSAEATVICEECKYPMEKLVLYQCQGDLQGCLPT